MCLCDRCYIKVVCSVADSAEEVGDLFSVTVLLAVHRTPPSLPPTDVDGEVGGVGLLLCMGVSQQVRSERHQHRPQP